MSFNKSNCIIRKTFCGNGSVPADSSTKKYSRAGTPYECLKKGIGVGTWETKKAGLSSGSLQTISYIGPVYESNFKKKKIYTTATLVSKMRPLSGAEKKRIISGACSKANGAVDQKAVNSVILFLHSRKVGSLPSCRIVRE